MKAGKQEPHHHTAKNRKGKVRNESGTKKEKNQEKSGLQWFWHGEAAPDGLEGDEGTFSMCTFWLVEALTRAGRLQEARLIFEKMLSYANHLRLYAEEVSHTGEQLGNFPQAFTHFGLISAATNLDLALNTRQGTFTMTRQTSSVPKPLQT